MYQVIDSRTQEVRGTFQSLRRASRFADKLDQEYGAVRYIVQRLA